LGSPSEELGTGDKFELFWWAIQSFLIFQNQRTVDSGFLEKEIRIKELPISVILKTSKN
jgi:hypothetical protein